MKNPIVRAALAAAYIGVVVSVFHLVATPNSPDSELISWLAPIAMLSLLTLSVAIMGFLFGSEPIALFMDNKRDEAVTFFFKTVAAFAVFAVLAFVCVILSAH